MYGKCRTSSEKNFYRFWSGLTFFLNHQTVFAVFRHMSTILVSVYQFAEQSMFFNKKCHPSIGRNSNSYILIDVYSIGQKVTCKSDISFYYNQYDTFATCQSKFEVLLAKHCCCLIYSKCTDKNINLESFRLKKNKAKE